MDLLSYLDTPETNRKRELVYGMVRDSPAPFCSHQICVVRLVVALETHVQSRGLGSVLVSPVDVILEDDPALIVQPDVVFVSTERSQILRHQIWGAPDLVAEVLSPSTDRYDRRVKIEWYLTHGVREYWLIDVGRHAIERVIFEGGRRHRRRVRANGRLPFESLVLPDLQLDLGKIFNGLESLV